ncbi:MAG: TIGR03089 family protein, partial [Mycobacterium sp.]|nr:TIGR03089 family protein [Mycobacterium sp.]
TPGDALDGRSAADVLAAAQASAVAQALTPADRVMSTAGWDSAEDVINHLLAVYVVGASLVQVANPNPDLLDRRRQNEKLTRA